ncbi:MAG: DUF2842 domain-containing protein [Sphingomonas sp.]|uniref:DUF2842 domain-containing protein n=1 Tax=Sphingomonas sp. TaxID=28214 RepID=UPI00356773D4
MTPSWRKPVGMLAILVLIGVWCLLVVSLSRFVGGWHPLLQAAFYLIAGIAWIWILPMRRMLAWMETGKFR